jgi:hypothetical protein
MLSSKGNFCAKKGMILTKMQSLLDQLQGLKNASESRMAYREEEADASKRAWLDAEGTHATLQSAADRYALDVKDALKKVVNHENDVKDESARLEGMRANHTRELAEIAEEETIIREILSYIEVCRE